MVRSTTADIVNKGETKDDDKRKEFLRLRRVFAKSRSSWIEALNSYRHVHSATLMPSLAAMQGSSARLKSASQLYMKNLGIMAQNGIWNCGEFADFAFMMVSKPGILKEGYTAYITSLNDPQIPEGSQYYEQFQLILSKQTIPEDENHDHVFIVIKNRHQQPAFVIDLWQSLVESSVGRKPFIGTYSAFIGFLNENVDGQYVAKPVSQKDFAYY